MNDIIDKSSDSVLQKTAINMLRDKQDLKFISSVTGFSVDELLKLKNQL